MSLSNFFVACFNNKTTTNFWPDLNVRFIFHPFIRLAVFPNFFKNICCTGSPILFPYLFLELTPCYHLPSHQLHIHHSCCRQISIGGLLNSFSFSFFFSFFPFSSSAILTLSSSLWCC